MLPPQSLSNSCFAPLDKFSKWNTKRLTATYDMKVRIYNLFSVSRCTVCCALVHTTIIDIWLVKLSVCQENGQWLIIILDSVLVIVRGVETLSWLPDTLTYFYASCPATIYFVYSSVSIYQTFTRFIRQSLHDWLFPHHW